MIKIKLKSGCSGLNLKTVDEQKSLLFIKIDDNHSDIYYIVIDKMVRSVFDVVSLLSNFDEILEVIIDDRNPVNIIEKRGLRDIIG